MGGLESVRAVVRAVGAEKDLVMRREHCGK